MSIFGGRRQKSAEDSSQAQAENKSRVMSYGGTELEVVEGAARLPPKIQCLFLTSPGGCLRQAQGFRDAHSHVSSAAGRAWGADPSPQREEGAFLSTSGGGTMKLALVAGLWSIVTRLWVLWETGSTVLCPHAESVISNWAGPCCPA